MTWKCDLCGHEFEFKDAHYMPTENLVPPRVIVFCPNPKCKAWMIICEVLVV